MTIDSKQLPDAGKFQLRASLIADNDITPDDFDCYTPKQIAAWRNDEWQFVGLIVEVSLDGRQLGDASLWGIEYGYLPVTDEQDQLLEPTSRLYDPLEDMGSYADVVNMALDDAASFVRRIRDAN